MHNEGSGGCQVQPTDNNRELVYCFNDPMVDPPGNRPANEWRELAQPQGKPVGPAPLGALRVCGPRWESWEVETRVPSGKTTGRSQASPPPSPPAVGSGKGGEADGAVGQRMKGIIRLPYQLGSQLLYCDQAKFSGPQCPHLLGRDTKIIPAVSPPSQGVGRIR